MKNRPTAFVPALYKLFDEVLVNAADNKQRDSRMSGLRATIDQASNTLSVWNDGEIMDTEERMTLVSMDTS
jgi:DNA topoisomerase II